MKQNLLSRPLSPNDVRQWVTRGFADKPALRVVDGQGFVVKLLHFGPDYYVQIGLSLNTSGGVLSDTSVLALVLSSQLIGDQVPGVLF